MRKFEVKKRIRMQNTHLARFHHSKLRNSSVEIRIEAWFLSLLYEAATEPNNSYVDIRSVVLTYIHFTKVIIFNTLYTNICNVIQI